MTRMTLKQVKIKRIVSRDDGVFGVLLVEGFPICVTLELPWKDNQRRVSCIPAGQYECQQVHSPKFGKTFMVMDVPNRSEILFHGANTVKDLLGCIGLGEFFHSFNGQPGILNPTPKAAFNEFMNSLSDCTEFLLEITEHF